MKHAPEFHILYTDKKIPSTAGEYSEQFIEHTEYAFSAFCKIVLRHEAGYGELNVNKSGKEKHSPDGTGDTVKKYCGFTRIFV